MRPVLFLAFLGVFAVLFSGCGETIHGVGKDINRIGYGVKTIFVSQK